MIWQQFRFRGKLYLAVKQDNGVGIIDSDGRNYGVFFSVDSFRKFVSKSNQNAIPLGTAQVRLCNFSVGQSQPLV